LGIPRADRCRTGPIPELLTGRRQGRLRRYSPGRHLAEPYRQHPSLYPTRLESDPGVRPTGARSKHPAGGRRGSVSGDGCCHEHAAVAAANRPLSASTPSSLKLGRHPAVRMTGGNIVNSTTKAFLSGTTAILFGMAANLALAADGENFVDEASAKGIAEIETAKLALDKSDSEDVRSFAQKMIDDHTQANQKLAEIAGQQEDLEISDNATLMDKAKAMILQFREGENFDKDYANNQVMAHEQTIKLFREYAQNGENAELKQFAETTLPKLEQHLKHAQELASTHGAKQ